MNDGCKITFGDATEEEATRCFIEAWYRAKGETFRQRRLEIESCDAFARISTVPPSSWSTRCRKSSSAFMDMTPRRVRHSSALPAGYTIS
jgi:hypothetical protein